MTLTPLTLRHSMSHVKRRIRKGVDTRLPIEPVALSVATM